MSVEVSTNPPTPILQIDELSTHFPVRSKLLKRRVGSVHAVDGVSLAIAPGETLGLVGESGCGKSTLARTTMGLVEQTRGTITFNGTNIASGSGRDRRSHRREMQMVFQDPVGSLDPRQRVRDIVAEPLITYRVVGRRERSKRVEELLELVGLDGGSGKRFPHEFSGGQRQRIGIARALALNPRLLVLDEPVSALDVSIQAQILNLLQDLQSELGLAYLLISHDLAVVRHVAHRVAVMYLGRIVEQGKTADLFTHPGHPYTKALLSAVPDPDPSRRNRARIVLEGDIPSPIDPPSGCRFRTRCDLAEEICATLEPELTIRPDVDHPCACHFAGGSTPVQLSN